MEEDKEMHPLSIPKIKVIASTKSEMYKLLKNEGNYYLPPLSQTDGNFIHDAMTGVKKIFKLNKINYISVPHSNNLKVSDILQFAKSKCSIDKYLPDLKKGKVLPRDYICNIVNTVIPDKFEEFVANKVAEQEKTYVKKKRLDLMVLPEFKHLFDTASRVSRSNGNFVGVIKNTLNRRIELEKNQKTLDRYAELEMDLMEKDEKILALEERINDFKEERLKHQETIGKMSKLYDLGVIDEDGELRNSNE